MGCWNQFSLQVRFFYLFPFPLFIRFVSLSVDLVEVNRMDNVAQIDGPIDSYDYEIWIHGCKDSPCLVQ